MMMQLYFQSNADTGLFTRPIILHALVSESEHFEEVVNLTRH